MDRWGLTFDGNGATFKAMTDGDINRRHWWFFGGGNLTLRNMTVVGANPNAGVGPAAYRRDREFQHAYALQGVQGALLENLQAYDVYGDFVYIDADGGQAFRQVFPRPWAKNVTVRNSKFERNGRHGVSIIAAEDVAVEGNYFGDIRWDAFDIESDSSRQGAHRIRIERNTTGKVRLVWLGLAGPGTSLSEIVVRGNQMLNMSGVPIIYSDAPEGARWTNFTIEGNLFRVGQSPRGAFEFKRSSDVRFQLNTVFMPPSRYASPQDLVRLKDSNTAWITRNEITGKVANVVWADSMSYDYRQSDNVIKDYEY